MLILKACNGMCICFNILIMCCKARYDFLPTVSIEPTAEYICLAVCGTDVMDTKVLKVSIIRYHTEIIILICLYEIQQQILMTLVEMSNSVLRNIQQYIHIAARRKVSLH